MAEEPHFVRFVRSNDPTCACEGCQEDHCEGRKCTHYGFFPLLKVRIMSKYDSSPFSRKETAQLEKNPLRITERSTVSCPCGKFRGKVKELMHEEREYRCPVCGCFNLLAGTFYVRLSDVENYKRDKRLGDENHDQTLIYLYDFRVDGNPNGHVIIKGRIDPQGISLLQEYLKDSKETNMDHIQELAKRWLEKRGFTIVSPLYWEQVHL